MSKYRKRLPQLAGGLYLSEAGLETTLVFHDGLDLPCFAAFDLLKDAAGTDLLYRYYSRFAELARAHGLSAVFETPTWRANADWGAKLGYDATTLADANRRAVGLLLEVRRAYEAPGTKIVISGNLGPRGDGYVPGTQMSAAEAQAYHAAQLEVFAATDADMAAAFTINYVDEAIGITGAAQAVDMPVTISFTTETDGKLPSGMALDEAIDRTDQASGGYPIYYMINCAHPTHLTEALSRDGVWRDRIRGLRANASRRSHAELDASTDLDAGDAEELGRQYQELRALLPQLSIVGGCCGTDHRHVEAMCHAMGEGVQPVA